MEKKGEGEKEKLQKLHRHLGRHFLYWRVTCVLVVEGAPLLLNNCVGLKYLKTE